MKYSEKKQCWCVHPTRHTNYLGVVDWCRQRWGDYKIDNRVDGVWSYCDGEYYGFVNEAFGSYNVPDTRQYFSFDRQQDALLFELKWA